MQLVEFQGGELVKLPWTTVGTEFEHVDLPFLPFDQNVHLNFLTVVGILAGRLDKNIKERVSRLCPI